MTESTHQSPSGTDERNPATVGTARQVLSSFRRSGNATAVNAWPVVLGLVGIWGVFYLLNDSFVSAVNLTNLMLQVAGVATISIGTCLVLLIGHIDLSVGSVSGVAATVLAAVNVQLGLPAPAAIALAILAGVAIGLIQGLIVTTFGVPSFVATLGGLISWQGLQLFILGRTGAINLRDSVILGLTDTFFGAAIGWLIVVACIAVMAAMAWRRRSRRSQNGLENPPVAGEVVHLAVVGAILTAVALVFTLNRGVPLVVLIVVGLVVVTDYFARRTTHGRRIYAIGGDATAAERVGIKTHRTVLIVFVLSGVFAALGGVLTASRLQSVTQSAGGGGVLLFAIAGVVIGGTSLFGGRGSIWSALLGALVIGSIANGMDLLFLPSPVKLMITGAVLVIAVVFDASSQRRNAVG